MATAPGVRRRVRLAPEERRRAIVRAAARLYREGHADSVSLEQVAEAAGVTRGLVHHYFRSKRELHVAVVREMFRGGQPPVPEYRRGMTPEQRLDESVARWIDMIEANRETWLAALGAEGLGHDPEVEAILDRVRESAVDNVIEVLGLGPAQTASPELRAVIRAFGGLAEASAREWLQRDRIDRPQLHALLVGTLTCLVDQVLPTLSASTPVPS